MRCWLLVVGLACGCATQMMSTSEVATFGYRRAPAVALVTTGAPELGEAWRAGVKRGLTTAELPAAPDEEVCVAARALSPPPLEILIADVEEKSEEHLTCLREDCSARDAAAPNGECTCVDGKYGATSVHAIAKLRVLDTASCMKRTEVVVHTPPIRAESGSREADHERARHASMFRLEAEAERQMRELYVLGEAQVVRQEANELEVEHDGGGVFAPGAVYYLRNEKGPRVVVARADAAHATLVADTPPGKIVVGDELHAKELDNRFAVFPSIIGGRLEGNHGIGGLGITARWSANQLPLLVEAALAMEFIPAFESERYTGGLAAGLRWPLGPVNPIAIAEAGLSHATQMQAESDGGFVGLGAGVELWLGKLCLFADIRQRWQRAQDWKDSADDPVVVKYPTTDYAMTVVQLGFAWRTK